jgi:hypothetical protein
MLTTKSLEVAPHGMEVLRLVVIIYNNYSSNKLLVMAQCSTFCVLNIAVNWFCNKLITISTHVHDNCDIMVYMLQTNSTTLSNYKFSNI